MWMHRTARWAAEVDVASRHCTCEPLEQRLLCALSKSAGGSGYSGTLSTNTATRQQQLICDPDEPAAGSTSVLYDAQKVTLAGLIPGPGYDNFGFVGLVEVRLANGTTVLQPYSAFRNAPLGRETGYAQVVYKLEGTAGQLAPPAGYTVVEEAGVSGVDTHAFFFALRPGVPDLEEVRYQVYAERRDAHSNNREDGLTTTTGQLIGPDELSPAFVSSNFAPVIASTGGPYTIAEGASLALTAAATDVETLPQGLTYLWDVNGDGVTDATGPTATIPALGLKDLGLADGPVSATVRLTVSDGSKSAEATTALTVTNVDPAVTLSAAGAAAYVGTPITVSAAALDPALFDSQSYAWSVNGTPTNVTTPTYTFTPAAAGTYVLSVTVTDDDGGVGTASQAVSVTVEPETVARAQVMADPAYPNRRALFVWGTKYADIVTLTKAGASTGVTVGALSLGDFSDFGRLIVRGLGGSDSVRLDYTGASQVVFFGGGGDDRLFAGNYQSILVGGPGNDELVSGNAKDLLAGGAGADTLRGGGGDDLLLGAPSAYDAGSEDDSNRDLRAWSALLDEWAGGSPLATRQAHIAGTLAGGLNGPFALRSTANGFGPATLFSEAAVTDLLDGGNGKNWLLTL
jgi:hypothetical protein